MALKKISWSSTPGRKPQSALPNAKDYWWSEDMRIPFFNELSDAQNILIAGAGGGFDIFCGLPLYFWLKKAGKTVHLANLSFTDFGFCDGERPAPSLVRVRPDTSGSQNYFPEVHLSTWLSTRFGDTPVYAIEHTGVRKVVAAY